MAATARGRTTVIGRTGRGRTAGIGRTDRGLPTGIDRTGKGLTTGIDQTGRKLTTGTAPTGRELTTTIRRIARGLGLAGVLFFVLTLPGHTQPGAFLVEDWSKQPAGKTGVPDGWKAQNWGSPKYDFRIVADGSRKVLHMKSEDEGSTISKEIKVDLKEYPVLEWRWKAVSLPKGADSRRKETDDQGAQVYVTFPRFPSAVRSRIIGYVWDTTAPAGLVTKSEKTGTVTYVIVRSGPGELGKWITETRNVLEDYKRIYGEDPAEHVGAVSVAIDSNDTHSTAESFMAEIRFRKP